MLHGHNQLADPGAYFSYNQSFRNIDASRSLRCPVFAVAETLSEFGEGLAQRLADRSATIWLPLYCTARHGKSSLLTFFGGVRGCQLTSALARRSQ